MVADIDYVVALRTWRFRHHIGSEVRPRKTDKVLRRAGMRVWARLRGTNRLHVSGCNRRAISLGYTEAIIGHQARKASNRDYDIRDRGLFVGRHSSLVAQFTWCRNASSRDAMAIFDRLSNGKKMEQSPRLPWANRIPEQKLSPPHNPHNSPT